MKLNVLGSNSNGNCYILEDLKGNKIMLEAGFSYEEICRRSGYDLTNMKGVFVSHEHKDHAHGVDKIESNGYTVYCPMNNNIIHGKTIHLEPFSLTPFKCIHDTECYGAVIYHEETGPILFATDTLKIPVEIKNIGIFIIEANYSKHFLQEMIDGERIHFSLAKRISQHHMSFEQAMDEIEYSKAYKLRSVVLIHLSDMTSSEDYYKTTFSRKFGIMPYLADKGMEVIL